MALTTADESSPSGIDYARYFLYNDPTWPWQALDYSTTQPADKLDPDNATASNLDLTPFHARSGKLTHHHGLADGSIAMGSGIHLYNQVLRLLKPKGVDLDAFYRFFLVPGTQRCGGVQNALWFFAGSGQQVGAGMLGPLRFGLPRFGPPSTAPSICNVPGYVDPHHDAPVALVAWVENGTVPG
jgi:feruloyl esterase